MTNAILEGAQKQCPYTFTNGEELRNSLQFRPVGFVFIKVCLWCVAAWTGATVVYIAFKTASGRLYGFTVLPLYVRDVFMVISWFKMDDSGEIVHFEFLVFRGMGIIKDPLFQWDVSANEV